MNLRVVGWILVVIAGAIILYNVANSRYNEQQMEDHPWITIFSGGANLKEAYTFTPPYTGFEIVTIAGGILGIVLIVKGSPKKPTGGNQ